METTATAAEKILRVAERAGLDRVSDGTLQTFVRVCASSGDWLVVIHGDRPELRLARSITDTAPGVKAGRKITIAAAKAFTADAVRRTF